MNAKKMYYKYQKIGELKNNNTLNYTLDNLSKNQLYFEHPTKYNDPFDCKIKSHYKGSENAILSHFKDKIDLPLKDGKLDLDHECFEKEGEDIIFNLSNEEYRKQNEGKLHGDIRKIHLPHVCCFSKNDDNILMWSHYAENHRGICLRFQANPEKPNDYLILNSRKISLKDVRYDHNFSPTVNMLDDENRDASLAECLFIKYIGWEYECESRMIIFEDELNYGTVQYEKEALEGIIFGSKIKYDNAKRLYDVVKNNYAEVNFYQAKESDVAFSLKIEKINDIGTYLTSLEE